VVLYLPLYRGVRICASTYPTVRVVLKFAPVARTTVVASTTSTTVVLLE